MQFFIKLHNYLAGVQTIQLKEFREKLTEFSGVREQKIEAVTEANSNFYSPGFITRALAIGQDFEEENEGTTVLGAYNELDKYEEGTTALGVDNGRFAKTIPHRGRNR